MESMEFKFFEFAYCLKAGGVILAASWILEIIKKVAEDKIIKTLRDTWHPEIGKMQTHLFGMHNDDFAPLHGFNKWYPTDGSETCYGDDSGGFPIPPYDYSGLCGVAALYGDFRRNFSVKDHDEVMKHTGSVLLLGGTRVNEKVRNLLQEQNHLPFQFVHESEIRDEFIAPHPKDIQRVFTDLNGRTYRKRSKTGRYLVSLDDPDQFPFGPFVSEEGRITRDVIVLTIVPGRPLKRIVWVAAGYGACHCLPEIFNGGDILDMLCSSVQHVASPWLQAAFLVDVDHGDTHETYKSPQLLEVKALGNL